ncbi:MAG: MFS transporter, partial [Helicobacter sp.]|nr:MFS transporter [Helicobacter sp.]
MSVAFLSLVLACRFFGLFVVMPLLALYVLSFEDCTPLLLGLSMGIYALSQVLFQIPFGSLSDKYGRKPLIALGIIIFIIGSLVCAFAQSAQMLVFGRFLQGVGAIGGVVSAMIADVVPESRRTKAMATMGASISLSFAFAMIIGSIEKDASTLFVLACILSAFSLLLLFFVPNVAHVQFSYSQKATDGANKNLWIMNASNFLQKKFMTFAFVIIPLLLARDG